MQHLQETYNDCMLMTIQGVHTFPGLLFIEQASTQNQQCGTYSLFDWTAPQLNIYKLSAINYVHAVGQNHCWCCSGATCLQRQALESCTSMQLLMVLTLVSSSVYTPYQATVSAGKSDQNTRVITANIFQMLISIRSVT